MAPFLGRSSPKGLLLRAVRSADRGGVQRPATPWLAVRVAEGEHAGARARNNVPARRRVPRSLAPPSMLSRIVKLIEARRALRAGRLHEALSLAEDSAIRDDRRAREIGASARERLLERAEERRARGELSGALIDLRSVLAAAPTDDRRGRELLAALRAELGSRDEVRELERAAVEDARAQLARGWLYEARVRLSPHVASSEAAARLARELDQRLAHADAELDRADQALRRDDAEGARAALAALERLCRQHPGRERLVRELARHELAALLARARAANDVDALGAAWEELRCASSDAARATVLPEVEQVRIRLAGLLAARLREELLRGEPQAIGAAARRWLALDPVGGAELPGELGGAVDAIADASALAELGASEAPQVRLARASGGVEVEAGLLQVGVRLQALTRVMFEFAARARRAIENGSCAEWDAACARAVAALPSARVPSDLLAASAEDGAAQAPPTVSRSQEDRGGRALAELVAGLRRGLARAPEVAAAWERLERTRAEAESVLVSFAAGRLDPLGIERAAQRLAALELLAADSPWLALARRTLVTAEAIERAHAAVRASLVASDLLGASRAIASAEAELRGRREAGCEVGLAEIEERALARERRALARAVHAAFERGGWHALGAWLDATNAEGDGLRAQWRDRRDRERAVLREELERRRAAGEALASAEWERARALLPGDPLLEGLHDRGARHAALDERVRRAEWLSDRRDYSGAWDELRSIEDAGPFRTRIFDLKRRVQRERGLGQRFFLRIEEGGEYLVLLGESVRIGNARVHGNDLPILANISSHHAELSRSTTFHGGTRYLLKGLDARPVTVGGRPVPPEGRALTDGDLLRFGASLEISFHQPSPRSQSAVLRLRDGFDVQGVERVILMKPGGRSGRLLFGPEGRAHLRAPQPLDLELWVDEEGRLRGRSDQPWRIDGHAVEASDPVLPCGAWVESGGLRFGIDPG